MFYLERRRPSHLSVHVGAVQVDLAAVGVDEITHLPDVLLKHAEGGGVGEHHGCQAGLVFVRLEGRKERKEESKKTKKKKKKVKKKARKKTRERKKRRQQENKKERKINK